MRRGRLARRGRGGRAQEGERMIQIRGSKAKERSAQKTCFYADAESTGASHTGEMPAKRASALRERRATAVVCGSGAESSSASRREKSRG